MNESETPYAIGLLKRMAVLEVALADFYAACASRGYSPDVTTRIANDELGHSNCFEAIADVLKERKGAGFSDGQPMAPENIEAFTTYIKGQTQAVVEGKLSHGSAFAAAAGMERRFLESRYAHIVNTDDGGCQAMIATIMDETAAHVKLMSGGS
ncbi:MAG: hypothetical protein AAB152_09790 [Candidatus Coatesbacteria bacterium]